MTPSDHFRVEETWIFEPRRPDYKPYAFIRELYTLRQKIKQQIEETGQYDIMEKVIKLLLNSLYGKMAQGIGRPEATAKDPARLPTTANPFYAMAITASCRRRVVEAACLNPHAVVFFATDGLVTTEELKGLPRVVPKGEPGELGG